jgi:hypothetical protein
VLQNAAIGIEIASNSGVQAQAELNEVWIKPTVTTSVKISGTTTGTGFDSGDTNNLILDSFGTYELRLANAIELANDAYITAYWRITCPIKVKCSNGAAGRRIMVGVKADSSKGEEGYVLTQTDADYVYDADDAYGVLEMADTLNDITELIFAQRRYLDGTKTTNGNGTLSSPFNNLASALSGINAYQMIIVTGTTPLTGSSYSGSTTIQRGPDLTGPMFTVASGVSTMLSWKTITDRGQGTIVQVNGGSLTLAGGVELCHCDIAVDVVSGDVDLSQTIVEAESYSIYMGANSGALNMSAVAVTSVTGPIYLASGKVITADRALVCDLTVKCESPAFETVIMTGSRYTLTSADVAKVTYANAGYDIVLNNNNQMALVNYGLYVDGTATANGDGSYTSPYNNLLDAVNVSDEGGLIYITGTTALSGSYTKNVTIRRGLALTGSMFTVAGTAELSGLTVNGGSTGTIVMVNSGTLSLSGGVTLTNCNIAVDIIGGNLTMAQAVLSATQYSIRMNSGSGTFSLEPVSGSQIDGTIYFASGKWITVTGTGRLTLLTGDITVAFATATNGTWAATKVDGTFNNNERNKFKSVASLSFTLSEDKKQIIVS